MWEVKPAHWFITIIEDAWLLDKFWETHGEWARWGCPLLERCLRECYLLGKVNKCSRLGKCIDIVGDWTSKSGHISYAMYYLCMFMCMHILNWCLFYAWYGVRANTSFMMCVWNIFGRSGAFVMFLLSDHWDLICPWNRTWGSWYLGICNVFWKGRNSRAG